VVNPDSENDSLGESFDGERLNVRQIAKIAGVSTATVSRVYRGIGQVSPEMRERVSQAIQQHGYRPSHFGTALANRRNGALGIVFPGLSGPYFGELIEGFDQAAIEAGVSVNILGAHVLRDAAHDLEAMAERVDGLAIHAGVVPRETVERLARHVPVVVIGGADDEGSVQVRSDHDEMRELVTHLIRDHGHRDLVFLGRPSDSPDIEARHAAYVRSMADAGIAAPPPILAGLTQTEGVLSAPIVLDMLRAHAVDAVVCANDELALGLMFALLGDGVKVPDDIAITGVDNVPIARLVRPGITTLERPLRELSGTAARLLLRLIAGEDVPRVTTLPSRVVRRSSCGCPAASD
jgi:LacI family transcriptional regulator